MFIKQYKEMDDYIQECVYSEKGRVIISIVRKALSVLFGTASESDVKLIKQKLANLKINQKELAQFHKEKCICTERNTVSLTKN